MPYVTLAQLAEKPGPDELAQVATADHLEVVDAALLDLSLRGLDRSDYSAQEIAAADAVLARITEIIAEVDETIDGYLACRVQTLPVSPVPKLLLGIARALVRYRLHKDLVGDDSRVVQDYKDQMKVLEALGAGRIKLGVADPASAAETRNDGLLQSSGRDRLFSRDSLERL